MGSNRLAFIRNLRKHALLRTMAEMDDRASVEFDRKMSEVRETTESKRNN